MSVFSSPFKEPFRNPFGSPFNGPGVGGGFNPALWFLSGEQGIWLDPSDFTTMFQDAAGTTPVTAVEQPVGLILDKSGRGNHASQPTAAARPVLSARKNLLTYSEDFTNAEWAAYNGLTKTADTLTFVNANSYAQYDSGTLGGAVTGTQVTFSLTLSTPTPQTFSLVIIDGVDGDPSHPLTVNTTSTPTRFVHSTTIGASFSGHLTVQIHGNNTITPGTVVTVAEPQLEVGPTATTYQRVTTSTDYDTVGFPHYFALDRVDDHATVAAGGGGTTGICVCAAIRAGGAGNARTIWSDRGTNTGYRLSINASNQLVLSAGNGSAHTEVVGPTVTAGTDYVVTGWHDGTNLNVQVNAGAATSAAFGTAAAGTAGFTIGKDNGAATGYYGDRIYEIVYRKDDTSSAGDRTSLITYMAEQAGITL